VLGVYYEFLKKVKPLGLSGSSPHLEKVLI